ncbi:unnamed protein product [Rotaria magnacalcarata]|uniref:Uncharacterized protein n=2 Tax=Rotaria magnacalcarata TaxID=392030 RepID=A0A8S2SBN8_9BILA|nr:unnamed protein product [Rotaria magnacalcarata]CAF4219750.1 unnamed protein product [Rotaria magnacalcarata]
MAQSHMLVIFDYSGSMNGQRYQDCHAACMKLQMPCEFWLFGSDVQKKGIVTSIPTFGCNSGTSITIMLETLHQWMSSTYNKQVCIFTDGEDKYDEATFTAKFNQIRNRNHSVSVYDICRTNVEPLKRIFASISCTIVTTRDEIDQLVQQINQNIAIDNDLLQGITRVENNVQKLIVNYQKLEKNSKELKILTDKLTSESQTIQASADQAIVAKEKQKLETASNELKQHISDIADHIKRLKENERKIKRLNDDIDDARDTIAELNTKIKAETNSPNPNIQKIQSFQLQIVEQEKKIVEIEDKISTLKQNSASAVQNFELLRDKTEETQTKVTSTLKTIN